MSRQRWRRVLLFIALLGFVLIRNWVFTHAESEQVDADVDAGSAATTSEAPENQAAAPSNPSETVQASGSELPDEEQFLLAAESSVLKLYADVATGHFFVEDKRDSSLLRSYPDPAHWDNESIDGVWRSHIRSPLMLELIDFSQRLPTAEVTGFIAQNGEIADWTRIDNGFKVVFHLPAAEVSIPVEVRVVEDYVETKVIYEEIVEGKKSLINVKVYPAFGAVHPVGQDGYMMLPDGSGALYRFKENVWNDRSIYREPIYGQDIAFNTIYSLRNQVALPVYGMKSGDKAFLAVAHEGAEFGYVYAAPSGAYSRYNWAAFEHSYRLQFHQPTSRKENKGFMTYSKVKLEGDRTVRYYVLDKQQSDYVGMAARYREYLLKEQGVQQLVMDHPDMPLYLDLVGGDIEKGFMFNRYIKGTTTEEAEEIVDRLHAQGIHNMVITYRGWQSDGFSNLGFRPSVDSSIGGNSGMKIFIEHAQSLGYAVNLEIEYMLNSNGKGFNRKRQGLQDQGRVLQEFYFYRSDSRVTLVSPVYSLEKLKEDISHYASLGVNGLSLESVGSMLNSDYNKAYMIDRMEAADIHHELIRIVKEKLGSAAISYGNAYALQHADYIHALPSDYSYDLFIDEPIPFAQIALHGLVQYSTGWANTRDEYKAQFLRSIEYGAVPSFILMNAPTKDMERAFSVWHYSLNFAEWEETLLAEYKRYNDALGDVQDQFITGHRRVDDNVMETSYSNGKRIIVNYNTTPVMFENHSIDAQDFIVLREGE